MTWSTLVEGDEQLDRLRGKSTYELMHSQLKQKTITYCVAYWEGPYSCSSPSTKVLHDYGSVTILGDFLTFLVANFLSQIFDDLLGYFKNIILKVKIWQLLVKFCLLFFATSGHTGLWWDFDTRLKALNDSSIEVGPNSASFCLFSFFSHDKYRANFTIIYKSIDGVLGTRTRGGRMVGADEFTELWRHPYHPIRPKFIKIHLLSVVKSRLWRIVAIPCSKIKTPNQEVEHFHTTWAIFVAKDVRLP